MQISLNQMTLSDTVAREVRKMILNGTLRPGERINQVRLAEQMNISRGPLREALRMPANVPVRVKLVVENHQILVDALR